MGLFTDHKRTEWQGNVIEVEAKIAGLDGRIEFSLFVNSRRVDTAYAAFGKFTLRGEVPSGDTTIPITVWVHQKAFGTKYLLEIAGSKLEMQNAPKR